MKNLLHVNKILDYDDPTKEQVKAVFEGLMKKAKEFNQTRKGGEVFCFYIRWIGWDVERQQEKEKVVKTDQSDEEDWVPNEDFLKTTFNRYGLTKDREAVCVDMHCLQLASLDNTYVILHQDKDQDKTIRESEIDIDQ